MKSNQVMITQDRELFGVKIRQETKTGMLNLSDLQQAYGIARIEHGWSERNLTEVLNSVTNSERLFYVLEKQGFIKVDISSFMNEYRKSPAKYLKSIGVYKASGARSNKTVWCNPYVWMMVALEMNPMLYANVITWLTDKLILNRIEAGDFYKDFTKQISKWNPDYVQVAKGLNYIIFGKHKNGIRNNATEKQLKELVDIQKNLAFAIKKGYIKSESQLLEDMRGMYNDKWNNNKLSA